MSSTSCETSGHGLSFFVQSPSHAPSEPGGVLDSRGKSLGTENDKAECSLLQRVENLDGADLRMTHYCAAQNQPRLKASRIDIAHGIIEFSFVDITNLHSSEAGHVVGLELRFLAPDHIKLAFRFQGGGKTAFERIDLKRVLT
jgi:hypothetical protein